MGRAPCCEKVGLNRGPWTREEDMRLIQYIKAHGEGCWRTLPKAAGLLRCGKSCRLRWINYLRPDLKRGNISDEEDSLIIKLHSLLGNRWSLIAGRLPGRTDNEIKNYWNTHLKKKLRNMGIDPQTHLPLEKVPNTAGSHSSTPVTAPTGSCPSSYHGVRYDLASAPSSGHSAFSLQQRRITPLARSSPAMDFKAKPLDLDPTQLDALKRAASSFRSSLQIHSAMNIFSPSSPVSNDLSSSSSLTVDHHIVKDDCSPPSLAFDRNKQSYHQSELLLWSAPSIETATTSLKSECSSGSSSIEGSELFTILGELYPGNNAIDSSVATNYGMKLDGSKLTGLESTDAANLQNSSIAESHEDTKELNQLPASVLSFLESDFMWDLEMMHPIEDVETPTGLLPSNASDLWAHDCAQTDATASALPSWLNDHQDR